MDSWIKKFSSPKIKMWFEPNLTISQWCPWKESNPHHWVRSPVLYPLSYRGELLFINFVRADVNKNHLSLGGV